MYEWRTVGRKNTSRQVFGEEDEPQTKDEFVNTDDADIVTIRSIAADVKNSEDPLRTLCETQWFPVLSQSELSLEDLDEVLSMLELMIAHATPSKELLEFVILSLDHSQSKLALNRLLRTKVYEMTHFIVMSRYIELITACWTKDETLSKLRFKSVATSFFREFLKKEHSSVDLYSFSQVTECVKSFLENFKAQELEQILIDGYSSGFEPPDDFRSIPTYPRTQDIEGELPFLRRNVIKGPHRSLVDYLDIHFRLVREEYIAPLRNGIRDRREKKTTLDLAEFSAEGVSKADITDEVGTVTFKVTSNHGKFAEFKLGVLVAVPVHGSHNFIYLTCLDSRHDNYFVKLEFCNSNDNSSLRSGKTQTLLVLTSAYFEAFRHTLDALKNTVELPFQSSIVLAIHDESPPKHWGRRDQMALLRENLTLMNESQFEAFRQTLARKISVIQGPPGTGKTYVGLRLVETLLKYRVTESPVLVVCYTNHALDQFLEGMLRFTKSIVRVGGRSKSAELAPFNFEELRNKREKIRLSPAEWKRRSDCNLRLSAYRVRLQKDEQLLGYLQGRSLFRKSEMKKQCDAFSHFPECYELLEVFRLHKEYDTQERFSGNSPWISGDVVDMYINTRLCSDDVTEKIISDQLRKCRPLNRFAFSKIREKLIFKYCGKGRKPRQPLTLNEKWRFYATLHWERVTEFFNFSRDDLNDFREFDNKCQIMIRRLAESHKSHSDQIEQDKHAINQFRAEQDAAILRSKSIIGMTTSGAARRRDLLRELNCEVIVVEEAAEILEAHLVAILPQNTKQMILIGDHKQLSPVIQNYTLEQNFDLSVSLFERLINNGIPYVTLNVQHRMKNDFLKLLVPHIYPHITSSPTVYELERVQGVSKDLQFLTHRNSEQSSSRDSSKSNVYEANMVIALLEHLAYQGYEAHQVVVLCAYAGQQQILANSLRRANSGKTVRVSTIDDYQGEECDIVIVSFVRCNARADIGFLKRPNRVCVALSRAKKGLFCFGDFKAYATRSPLWKGIVDTLVDLGSLKPYLELECSTHGSLARVQVPADFARLMPLGRCQRVCGFTLGCGHECEQPCHLRDPHPMCRKRCLYIHPYCGHMCQNRCNQEHGFCEEIVPKLLACGHVEDGPCSASPNLLECHEQCSKILECGHRCGSLCSKPCTQECMVEVPITRDCEHDAVVACSQKEQERSKRFCKTRVEVHLNCGHSGQVQCCSTMDMEALTSRCLSYVDDVALPCGHSETISCQEHQNLESYACKRPVEVSLLCGHPFILPCHASEDDSLISVYTQECQTQIEIMASCSHKVSLPCGQSAKAAEFCRTRVEITLDCGHSKKTECFKARSEPDLEELMAKCIERSIVEAECSHLVEVLCNKRNDSRFLRSSCTTIVNVESTCGHNVAVVCPAASSSDFVLRLCKSNRNVTKTCKHTITVPCYDRRSVKEISGACEEMITNVLKCGHNIEQTCEGTLGDLEAECQQACGFVHRCGHPCTGNCAECRGGQTHQPCRKRCSRTLKCGHPCAGICGRRCSPCKASCQRQCEHGKCEKKCGEPCSSRKLTCRRTGVHHCPHQSCAATNCWECDCAPCDRACMKIHNDCGHPCEGLCNEPCIPCFRCKPKGLPKGLPTLLHPQNSGRKLLRVPGCDHVVDVEVMDHLMASWKIGIPRCVNCDREIPAWRRYNYVYNRIHEMSSMKGEKLSKVETERLVAQLKEFGTEVLKNELKEDTRDREMVRHFAFEIHTALLCRLKRWKFEDVDLCKKVFQVLRALVETQERVSRIRDELIDDKIIQEKIFDLASDTFDDLSAMVKHELPEEQNWWCTSTLDDISSQALRLELFALLDGVPEKDHKRLLNLVLADGRFSLPAANAFLKRCKSGCKIHPYYASQRRP